MKRTQLVAAVLMIALTGLLWAAGCGAEGAREAGQRAAGQKGPNAEKSEQQSHTVEQKADPGPIEVTEETGESSEQVYQELLKKFDAPEIPPPITPEDSYEQRLAKFGEDYSECSDKITKSKEVCEKPASLKRDLKQNINIELVLDASSSMKASVGGERKIDIARRVLVDFVDTLPETANVGLRVYGHKGSNAEADRDESCAASELIFPFQELDTAGLTDAINSFEPRGWTPVAGSLDKARKDFSGRDPKTNSNFVYLISDGVETCGGDPVAAARSLDGTDISVTVDVVGFDIGTSEEQQALKQIAEATGSEYYDAQTTEESEAIDELQPASKEHLEAKNNAARELNQQQINKAQADVEEAQQRMEERYNEDVSFAPSCHDSTFYASLETKKSPLALLVPDL